MVSSLYQTSPIQVFDSEKFLFGAHGAIDFFLYPEVPDNNNNVTKDTNWASHATLNNYFLPTN